MQLYFVEIGPHRTDIGLLTGGALLVHANDAQHAVGVADEWILEHGYRRDMKVKEARAVVMPNAHEACVIDRAFIAE
jgi:hypothetical protein